jgi:hypothetical protein
MQPFVDALLQLEAMGWKGNRGTALAVSAKAQAALQAGLAAMHSANRLRFWRMELDGRPIAALFALVDDGEVALGKIAHAEDLARFSPGVQIIMQATQSLFDDETCIRADSNAMPGHPMIDRLWRDRLDCADLLLAGRDVPMPVFQLLATWLGTKDAAKRFTKRVLAQTTGRKTS